MFLREAVAGILVALQPLPDQIVAPEIGEDEGEMFEAADDVFEAFKDYLPQFA